MTKRFEPLSILWLNGQSGEYFDYQSILGLNSLVGEYFDNQSICIG
jgi:hypothetical protein